jgi:hypothetical protein
VPDSEGAAGDCVRGGDVGRAVVGEDALDRDAVAFIERDRSAQKPDRGAGLLVCEDFDVGQTGGVINTDVHGLPADRATVHSGAVSSPRSRVGGVLSGDPLASAALDPPRLLDVDVEQLARTVALIALCGLRAPELADLLGVPVSAPASERWSDPAARSRLRIDTC